MPSRKSTGDPSHLIAAMNYFLEMNAGDYVEIMWRVSDVGVSIEQYPTSTSPDRPSIPSAIITLNYVAPSATTNLYVSTQQQGEATITHWANATADKTYGYIVVG
jgi:hypothetical protein